MSKTTLNKSLIFTLVILFSLILTACNKDSSPTHNNISKPTATSPKIIVENDVNNPPITEPEDVIEDKLDTEEPNANDEEYTMNDFYILEIDDEIFARMDGKSYKKDCSLPLSDLRYLHILYVNFDDEICTGELVVNKAIADDVLDIFKELYQARYQLERVELVDEYDAIDELSMTNNNSSAFNFRYISYTTTISKHGLGMAIDINPLYNPYVKEVNGSLSVEPANGAPYVDRDNDFPHKIDANDFAYEVFTRHGFTWGGNWKSSKDYQHFEIPSDMIREYYPDW